MYLTSSLLKKIPGIIHGFGTYDEPLPEHFSSFWESTRPKWKQVHGVAFSEVKECGQLCGEVDSLFTSKQQIPIGVVTADCVPVLLAHQSGTRIAAVHAGWRGTYARILERLWDQLIQVGEEPKNWVAAIGPSIGPCCYEVSQDLVEQFLKEFSQLEKKKVVPHGRNLDLPSINSEVLKKIGLQEVEILSACTRCSQSPRFHSYRREGGGTRQLSVIMKN